MKHEVKIAGETVEVSVRASELIARLKSLEKQNRDVARSNERHSFSAAIPNAVAEAYSTATLLFAELYGYKKGRPRK